MAAHFHVTQADPHLHGKPIGLLIERMYSWRGLTPVATSVTQAGPHQITLVMSSEDEVFGTLTVGLDAADGLLVDKLYPGELDRFREAGHVVCEFIRLAVDSPKNAKDVLGALFHMAYIHARLVHGATDVFIEVNPRHAPFYCRMLGFTQIGPQRMCPRVNAPAVLLHLDLHHATEQIALFGGSSGRKARSLYSHFYSLEEQEDLLHRMGAH